MEASSAEPRFGAYADLAEVYERVRPSYPDALVQALVRRTGVRIGDPVAELGAGTGKLTRTLSDLQLRVSAVEPVAEMREAAPMLANVRWTEGTFESTGLPSRSQSWAIAAQAFHRARLGEALPEIHRVLRPGGSFTALWYAHHIERSPVLAATYAMLRRHVRAYAYRDRTRKSHRRFAYAIGALPGVMQRLLGARLPVVGALRHRMGRGLELLSTGHFESLGYDELEHRERMPASSYLDVWRSRSVLRSIAGASAFEAFLDDLGRYLASEHRSGIEVPYVFGAWTARAR